MRGRPRAAPPATPLARQIQGLRLERGLTQAQLAGAVGASVRSLQQWEAGDQEPRASQLAALADALGVGVGELVG